MLLCLMAFFFLGAVFLDGVAESLKRFCVIQVNFFEPLVLLQWKRFRVLGIGDWNIINDSITCKLGAPKSIITRYTSSHMRLNHHFLFDAMTRNIEHGRPTVQATDICMGKCTLYDGKFKVSGEFKDNGDDECRECSIIDLIDYECVKNYNDKTMVIKIIKYETQGVSLQSFAGDCLSINTLWDKQFTHVRSCNGFWHIHLTREESLQLRITCQKKLHRGNSFYWEGIDANGDSIGIICWQVNDEIKDLQIGQVYILSNIKCGETLLKFAHNTARNYLKYCNDVKCIAINDDSSIPMKKYNFVSIKNINQMENNQLVDICGILLDISNPIKKMDHTTQTITIVDDSNYSIDLILWDDEVIAFEEAKFNVKDIIAIYHSSLFVGEEKSLNGCTMFEHEKDLIDCKENIDIMERLKQSAAVNSHSVIISLSMTNYDRYFNIGTNHFLLYIFTNHFWLLLFCFGWFFGFLFVLLDSCCILVFQILVIFHWIISQTDCDP